MEKKTSQLLMEIHEKDKEKRLLYGDQLLAEYMTILGRPAAFLTKAKCPGLRVANQVPRKQIRTCVRCAVQLSPCLCLEFHEPYVSYENGMTHHSLNAL